MEPNGRSPRSDLCTRNVSTRSTHRYRCSYGAIILLRDGVLSVYGAIGALVFAVIALGVSVTASSETAGLVAVALVLAGSSGLLAALSIAARALWLSHDAIDFETKATQSLGVAEPMRK
jgi:hypothetical protein